MSTPAFGRFHWSGGLCFRRLPDASVEVLQVEDGADWTDENAPVRFRFVIDANSWASAVLHCSVYDASAGKTDWTIEEVTAKHVGGGAS